MVHNKFTKKHCKDKNKESLDNSLAIPAAQPGRLKLPGNAFYRIQISGCIELRHTGRAHKRNKTRKRDGLGRRETLSLKTEMRLVQKLTRSLTRGIAFLFLRSGMLSMLYRAPPMLKKKRKTALFQISAVNNVDTPLQL